MRNNPEFYEGPLDATTYQRWLVTNGVQLVALPDAPLDGSSEAEAAVIATNPSYLQPVWHNAHWRVWRVVGSAGLTSAGAELVGRSGDEMTFKATAPGPVLVRVRWTRFWSLDGAACVEPAPDGWTRVNVRSPGTFTLKPAIRGERQHCDKPAGQ
jgi:hypothetical protein